MQNIKRSGLVLVAACAFSVVAASSVSASPLFLSHPTGLLLAKGLSSFQTFVTPSHQFECTGLKLLPPGDATVALKTLSLLLVADYEGCKVATLTLSAHPVRYLIDANGLVSMENDFLLLAGSGCLIKYLASKNQSLGTIKFDNTANSGLLLLANVRLMTSEGKSGKLSLCEFAEIGNGIYTGDIRLTLDSGTIRWDP